jgi:hypothetical protein
VWLLAACVGCGWPSEPGYPNTNLGGTITIDGAPVTEGMVSFVSLDPHNGRTIVTPIVRGRYIAEKVPLGKVLATVVAIKMSASATARPPRAGDPPTPEDGNLVPSKYRGGFELDVTPDSSEVNFTMTSR